MFLIVRRHRTVAVPRFVVGRLAGVGQMKVMGLPGREAAGLEMKPLKVRAVGVGFDRQFHVQRIAGIQHLNIAAVEVTADVK